MKKFQLLFPLTLLFLLLTACSHDPQAITPPPRIPTGEEIPYRNLTEDDGLYVYRETLQPQGFLVENLDQFNTLFGKERPQSPATKTVNQDSFKSYFIVGICKISTRLEIRIEHVAFAKGTYKVYYRFDTTAIPSSDDLWGILRDCNMAYVKKMNYDKVEFYENNTLVQTALRGEMPPPLKK